jgi:hypothetical protein
MDKNTADRKKVSFVLTDDQRGPYPIDTESIWCSPVGEFFRIENIPFLVDGIAFGDLVELASAQNGFVVNRVVESSGNSTVWLLLEGEEKSSDVLAALKQLGCGVEGGVFSGYFAANIPKSADIERALGLLQQAVDEGLISVDYPCIRGGETDSPSSPSGGVGLKS